MVEPDLFGALVAPYGNYDQFADMHDFIRNLVCVDPVNRLSARQALNHPWINAQPYSSSAYSDNLKILADKMLTVSLK